ncbi:MAG: HAMP domain-containing protein [Acidobacteria bacterium]|nr:HAMP domain-containing protein [Acidobacteriota bacterium]
MKPRVPFRFGRRGVVLSLLVAGFLVSLLLITRTPGSGAEDSPTFNLQVVLLAVLTVINALALLLLVSVLVRYLIKLFFEKRGRTLHTSVRTKLILAFAFLAVVPAGLFMFFSFTLISHSVNQWFSAPAEAVLNHAEDLAQSYYASVIDRTKAFLADYLEAPAPGAPEEALRTFRRTRRIDTVLLLDEQGAVVFRDDTPGASGKPYIPDNVPLILQNAKPAAASHYLESRPSEDVIIAFAQMPGRPARVIVFAQKVPSSPAYHAYLINEAYKEYFQLKNQVQLIRANYFLVVGGVGGMILLGFSWFGVYISRKITTPINALLEGSRRVASGDLSTPVACETRDEFEELIQSFNRMTEEIRRNEAMLEDANLKLVRINQELESRNTFIETVIDTIAAGVVCVDQEHLVTISNAAAASLLRPLAITDGRSRLQDVLPREKAEELVRLLKDSDFHGRVSKEVLFHAGKRTLHFAVTVTPMRDDQQRKTGYVIAFDDVTELLRTEKAAAWQEVARRLAHEIKNPLTPIQLSMERVAKQYRKLEEACIPSGEREAGPFRAFGEMLAEALQTVQGETRNLKYLVDEFSKFARLPVPVLKPEDLNALVTEIRDRCQPLHPEIAFDLDLEANLPFPYLDAELIRRVLVNLVDNAAESIREIAEGGRITLGTRHDREHGRVVLVVEDTGKGVPEDAQDNLFLPYVSTKQTGMGLGLTIVKKILDDHEAGIRPEPVTPHGLRMVIDFQNF